MHEAALGHGLVGEEPPARIWHKGAGEHQARVAGHAEIVVAAVLAVGWVEARHRACAAVTAEVWIALSPCHEARALLRLAVAYNREPRARAERPRSRNVDNKLSLNNQGFDAPNNSWQP